MATHDYQPDGMPKALTWTRPGGPVVRSHTEWLMKSTAAAPAPRPLSAVPTGRCHLAPPPLTSEAADRLTSWTSPFPDADGTGQRRTTYSLDDGGNALREQVVGGDGASRIDTRFTYNNGQLSERRPEQGGVLGLPAAMTCEALTYSGLGEESRRDTTQTPLGSALTGCVGGTTSATTSTYDPAGYTKALDDNSAANADAGYVYDTDDRLIGRTANTSTTPITTLYFYWGTGSVLAEETDGAGQTMVRYLVDATKDTVGEETHRAADGTRQATATWVWLLEDEAGNVATHLRDDGEVLEQLAFDPYGNPQAAGSAKSAASSGSTLGYQKAITDRLNGRVILGPRQYDPTTLRFTTPDTFIASDLDIGLATDEPTGNRYLFAAANPVAHYEDRHGSCLFGHSKRRAGHGHAGCRGGSAKHLAVNVAVGFATATVVVACIGSAVCGFAMGGVVIAGLTTGGVAAHAAVSPEQRRDRKTLVRWFAGTVRAQAQGATCAVVLGAGCIRFLVAPRKAWRTLNTSLRRNWRPW